MIFHMIQCSDNFYCLQIEDIKSEEMGFSCSLSTNRRLRFITFFTKNFIF